MKRCKRAAWVWVLCLLGTLADAEDSKLVIGAWGGPYETVQRAILFNPFEVELSVSVQTRGYFGGLEALQEESAPDLLDMLEEEAFMACEQGLLLELDVDQLFRDGPGAALDKQDFLEQAFSRCSIAHLTFSTLVAFDDRAFPGEKPQHITDLFDVLRYPGKRALKKDPSAILEWALMAEGVPISQVYNLLSTERGMRIALKRLDSIRYHIVWWDKPSEAVALLQEGDVVMASGYNGRFFEAWREGLPLSLIWHGQIIDRSVWAIAAGSENKSEAAHAFLRFALDARRQAQIAERIPYGPTRKSAFGFIGLHPDAGLTMTDHLPTAAHHLQHALFRDTHWYARTDVFRHRHFERWLKTD